MVQCDTRSNSRIYCTKSKIKTKA